MTMVASMTSRHRPTQQLGKLKAALLVGSIAAAVLGTNLVARKDAVLNPPAIVVPAGASQGEARTDAVNAPAKLSLPPVPQVLAPRAFQPVTRSRSSR